MLDRRALALLAGLFSIGASARASAQTSAPLDRFEPAPAGDSFFAVPSADVASYLRPALGLTWSYARDPLVLRSASGREAPLRWVDHQMILHAMASLQLFQRVEIDIDFPFTLNQGGTTGTLLGTSVTAPSGATLNDVRAGVRVVLLKQEGSVPAAALSFSTWLPTGDAYSFAGGGVARYAPALIVSAEYPRLVWSATVGGRFQRERPDQLLGSQVFGGAAVAFKWKTLQIGPELSLFAGAGDKVSSLVRNGAGAEILLGARYGLGPFTVGLGGGPGAGQSVGTPTYRLFASLAWSAELGAPPREVSATTTTLHAESKVRPGVNAPEGKLTAPPPDGDGDGVPDADDQCPTIVGDARPEAFRRGCPPDRDRDGVHDVDDHCPDVAGVASDDPTKNGCPADSDGDGILDTEDACPKEQGKPTSDPKTHGCPDAVRVEGTQIVLLQQVNFETARDEIKAESFGLLEQVVAALKQHPEIARVAVDGHTDGKGAEKTNINLSQRRALSVVRWLTEHGIDARRLEARGFGPRRPVADNTTEAGRAKNRRVEFLIKKRTELGEAGWRDGPVD